MILNILNFVIPILGLIAIGVILTVLESPKKKPNQDEGQ